MIFAQFVVWELMFVLLCIETLVCLAQFAWSPAFAYEKIPLSAFFMGCILLPLIIINVRQYSLISKYNESTTNVKPSDYWMLQFPFEIHLGWISAAFALNLNIVAVDAGASADAQVIVAAISLVVLALVAFAGLFGVKRPQFVFPWVAAWATVSTYLFGALSALSNVLTHFSSSN